MTGTFDSEEVVEKVLVLESRDEEVGTVVLEDRDSRSRGAGPKV